MIILCKSSIKAFVIKFFVLALIPAKFDVLDSNFAAPRNSTTYEIVLLAKVPIETKSHFDEFVGIYFELVFRKPQLFVQL